jgi:hypothetical protein
MRACAITFSFVVALLTWHACFWTPGTFHNYATPSPLHHEQYETYTDLSAHTPVQLYGLAAECFSAAAGAFKALAAERAAVARDAPRAARAAGGAAIALALLARGASLDVAFDVGPHRGWPSVSVRAEKVKDAKEKEAQPAAAAAGSA